MAAKLVFIAGLLGVGGFVGYQASNYDPAVFSYSQEQVESMLTASPTMLPRKDGDGQIKIWGAGRIKNGVMLNLRYHETAPVQECKAVIEALAADQTRVTPDCSDGTTSSSAIQRTTEELQVPMFEEFIQATLNQREFNRDTVESRKMGAVLKNMGAMQGEALKMDYEIRKMQQSQK